MTGRTSEETKEKPTVSGYGKPEHTPLSYNSYLRVEELKSLQECRSDPPHHDEPLFIIIHQTYELWFKLVLHELDSVVEMMKADRTRKAIFYMKRVAAILRQLVGQIHILETMSPKEFLGFRNLLNPASGFQSSQFREIEFAAGLKNERMLEHFSEEEAAYKRLRQRYEAPSLRELFFELLKRKGFDIDTTTDDTSAEEARIIELKKLYDDTDTYPDLHDLAELLLDLDELIGLWRAHHVTVVERIIGFKIGTGGSEGVNYLRTTLTQRCFPELWKVRTYLEL